MVGKTAGGDRAGARLPLPAQHRAHRRRQPGADRRVLVHPRGPGRERSACCRRRGTSLILAGRAHLDRAELRDVRRRRAGAQAGSASARASPAQLERRDDPLAQLPMSVPQSQLTGAGGAGGLRAGRAADRRGHAEKGIAFVVAEQNRETAWSGLRESGIHAVCGDAAEPAVAHPGARRARGDARHRHAGHASTCARWWRPRARSTRDRGDRAHPQRRRGRGCCAARASGDGVHGRGRAGAGHDPPPARAHGKGPPRARGPIRRARRRSSRCAPSSGR